MTKHGTYFYWLSPVWFKLSLPQSFTLRKNVCGWSHFFCWVSEIKFFCSLVNKNSFCSLRLCHLSFQNNSKTKFSYENKVLVVKVSKSRRNYAKVKLFFSEDRVSFQIIHSSHFMGKWAYKLKFIASTTFSDVSSTYVTCLAWWVVDRSSQHFF